MGLIDVIDFILNLAGLLLWPNWRAVRFDHLHQTSPATLVGTLKRSEPRRVRRGVLLAALTSLLLLRALFYWQIGSAVDWTANLKLITVAIPFRSDFPRRMMLFSILSFGVGLAVFFLWLLILSLFDRPGAESNPLHTLMRLQLG